MYRRSPSDRSAGRGECPPQRRRPDQGGPRRLAALSDATQPILGGLAQEVRMMASGDLLMRLRKHSTYKTAQHPILFPE
jgi:hypothetical protein